MQKKIFSMIFLITLSYNISVAGENGGGQPGAFLRNPVCARANGMGSAFTAAAVDVDAAWWNPGGLGYVERFQLSGMYSIMTLDRRHNFVSVALPLEKGNTLGFHWQQFGVSDIDGRDGSGNPTALFDDDEMALGLSYAFRLGNWLSIGATGKYLQHRIHEAKAEGYCVDAGALLSIKKIVLIGFTAQNIAGQLIWDTESELEEKLPPYYRAGVAIKPAGARLMLTFDAASFDPEQSEEFLFYGGGEFWIIENVLAIRAGSADGYMTAGGSVGFKSESFTFRFDFAYLDDVMETDPTRQISFFIGF